MNKKLKNAGVFMAAVILCFGLSGCAQKNEQAATNGKEALEIFFTSLQTNDFATAVTYLEEGNQLIHVFAAADGESVPELDDVYRIFSEQMSEMTYEIQDKIEGAPNYYFIQTTNRDYASSIADAMDTALQAQVMDGGNDFADFAGWFKAGVENASMGTAETDEMGMTELKTGYTLPHTGFPDHIFLNHLTGGFYDYADLSMTTCTHSGYEQESTYYLAAIGDELIASLMIETIPYDTSSMSADEIAELEAQFAADAEGMEGIWQSARIGDGTITTSIGINYTTADQYALVEAGFVDGAYRGNALSGTHLSLKSSIKSFEESGMTCVTVPAY